MRYLIIESRPWSGFFTNFLHTLQHLYRYDKYGRIPIIYCHGGSYAKSRRSKANIWEYYFEPVSKYSIKDLNFKTDDIKKTAKYLKTGLRDEPANCWNHKKKPPSIGLFSPNAECRVHVNSIIRKHIFVKDCIMKKISTFYNNTMKGHNLLAVHLRATRDAPERQGINPFDRFQRYIDKYISKHAQCKVFVATDCDRTLNKLKQEFGRQIIFYDSIRSVNGHPVQYGSRPERELKCAGPRVGEDALIDCILLSKCDFMIYGLSNLPACAAYFNPNIGFKFMCKY